MKPCMYLFVNKGLKMSTGKTAAQVAHAAVEAFNLSDPVLTDEWYKGGHYMKLVMECRDDSHLLMTERYLNNRGFQTALIIDEGHTEIPPITPTALGVEIVDKHDAHTAATFETFNLYRDKVEEFDPGPGWHKVIVDGKTFYEMDNPSSPPWIIKWWLNMLDRRS